MESRQAMMPASSLRMGTTTVTRGSDTAGTRRGAEAQRASRSARPSSYRDLRIPSSRSALATLAGRSHAGEAGGEQGHGGRLRHGLLRAVRVVGDELLRAAGVRPRNGRILAALGGDHVELVEVEQIPVGEAGLVGNVAVEEIEDGSCARIVVTTSPANAVAHHAPDGALHLHRGIG